MRAPEFSLYDQHSQLHSLVSYKGRWLIIYFYPKDDTPGCTTEACAFRDASGEFEKRGVKIVGISKDSIASHKRFAKKFKLKFPLLADPEGTVVEAYGAWGEKSMFGRRFDGILRNTYLVNPEGDIVKTYQRVNPLVHASQLLQDFEKLRSGNFSL